MSVPNAIRHFRKASIHRPYGMEKRSDAFMLLPLTGKWWCREHNGRLGAGLNRVSAEISDKTSSESRDTEKNHNGSAAVKGGERNRLVYQWVCDVEMNRNHSTDK